jgi:hypothetical protein
MVEVFRTNIETGIMAAEVNNILTEKFTFNKVNFDQDDCDRILRIESNIIETDKVIEVMICLGIMCEQLEDLVPEAQYL